jgi:pimeloyl-ACP methyl ester carboxylesterase
MALASTSSTNVVKARTRHRSFCYTVGLIRSTACTRSFRCSLTRPAADSFDVIVPSLPGFGFSDRPRERGATSIRTAELLAQLMTDVLGYKRFAAAGGDIGSRVTRLLALAHPESLVGIHLTDVGFPREIAFPPDLSNPSAAEQQFLGSVQRWFMQESGYIMIQSTKPQTLAYGLNDSPVGLAAWIVEKFRAWSDCGGDIEQRFSKDELLTNMMIYWVTETISSSTRLYYEDSHAAPQLKQGQYIEVPAGVATARIGRALLARRALDRDATRRPFRSAGGTQATGR